MADHKAEDTANDGAPGHERTLFVMLIVFRRIHFVIARYTGMFRRALSAQHRKGVAQLAGNTRQPTRDSNQAVRPKS